MYVKELKSIDKCNDDDKITFILDENSNSHYERGNGLKEATMVNVCAKKINGKIALSNGYSAQLLKGDERSIFEVK